MFSQLRPADYARLAFFTLLPTAAVTGAMALPVLLSLAGLASASVSAIRQSIVRRPLFLILLTAFFGWACLSTVWSPYIGATAIKIVALASLGILLVRALRLRSSAEFALMAAFSSLLVMSTAMTVEVLSDAIMTRSGDPEATDFEVNQNLARGLVILLGLTWPVIGWTLTRSGLPWRACTLCLTIATGWLSLQFGQLSTAVGFALGFAGFGAALIAPRLALAASTMGLAAWMLVAPFAMPPMIAAASGLIESLPFSSAARVMIWDYTSARIAEQPWIGHGLDAGRTVNDLVPIRGELLSGIPVHPHSASLQVWYELGAVGAVLAASLLAYGGWRLALAFQRNRLAAASATAVVVMFGFMANIGWSIWQEWWMATILLAAALAGAVEARAARA